MFKWIIGLTLGCCSVFVLPTTASSSVLIIALLSAFALLHFSQSCKQSLFRACCVLSSGLIFGLGWSLLSAISRLDAQIQPPSNHRAHIIEAEVDSLPVIYSDYCQLTVKVLESKQRSLQHKELLLKDYSSNCAYELGQTWQLTIKLKPIYGPVNHAGFDYEYYLFQLAIDGKGYIKQSALITNSSDISIARFRQIIYDGLNQFDNAGILQALIIGEKGNLPKRQQKQLQQLGLSHLIAISGLHITIIAGVSFWLMFKFLGFLAVICNTTRLRPYSCALIISCIAATCYSALADFSLPTVRALIMWCAVVSMVLTQRSGAFLSGLKLALLLILIMNPLSVLSASFWMSFIAVTVISLLLFGRSASRRKEPRRKESGHEKSSHFWSKLYQLFSIQFYLTAILAIPSIALFQQANFLGLIANIIMIPLFSIIILPLILIGVILYFLLNIKVGLVLIDQAISWFFELLSSHQTLLDLSSLELYANPWLLSGVAILALVMCLPLGRLKYPWLAMMLAYIGVFNIPTHTPTIPTMTVFDVGHGLSVLLSDGKHHILYDTGYASAGSSAFKSYILPSLRKLNIKTLDIFIVSHKDNDHSGGLNSAISSIPVKHLVAGQWLNSEQLPDTTNPLTISFCEEGYEQTIGSFHLKAIYPASSIIGDNNNSCVIKVTSSLAHHSFSILLPGDIEEDGEYLLASEKRTGLASDILLVPHHGSNSSSIYPFIKMVNPSIAIYSTERYSRYHLPHKKVIKRYRDFNINQLHTGCSGQISINLTDFSAKAARSEAHIWRQAGCRVLDK